MSPTGSIAAVVLAAGGSTRLGRPKQTLVVDGMPLVRRAAQAAVDAGCVPVVVVLGAEALATRAALSGLDVAPEENPDWPSGMASSIRVSNSWIRSSIDTCPVALGAASHGDRTLKA